MMEKYGWLFFALLSAVSAGLVAIFGKIGLKGIDSNAATAIRAIIMAVFLCIVVMLQKKTGVVSEILNNHKALAFITLTGICGALSWIFYFLALQYGEVSKVAPVDKLSVVFAIIMAFLFLGEKISIISAMGTALIAAGVIMVAVG